MTRDDDDRCEEELEAAREENALLRDAAGAFGALAERLSEELEAERLKNSDTLPHRPRPSDGRRKTKSG